MTIQKYNVLISLVETRKMIETAKILGVSVPTVSFHIKSLEEEYGVKFFKTNAGGYMLTEAGEIFYHYAKKIIQTNHILKKSIEDYKNGECGSIKLGASGVPAHIFMPELIHQFAEQYPGIKISLDVRTAPEIENQLLLQELDCALLVETENKKEGLIYESITMDEIVLAFSNTHPIAKKNGLEIDDLNNQTLLVHRLSSSTGWFSNSLLREIKFDMETIQLDSVSTIIKMLSYGKTVALISKSLIEEEEDLSYRKLKDKELERKIYFVYNRDIWRNDPFKYFQTLVNQLKEE